MIDFDKAPEQAFEQLSKTFSISKTLTKRKTKLGFANEIEQWKVVLEVPLPDKVKDFVVFIELKDDFPLSIPVIYLSKADYDAIKYIPHIDDRYNICLFDQENIKLDPDRPTEIIRICLKRAVQIIAEGISGANTSDYRDEIVAYWTNLYHANDQVFEAYLGEGVDSIVPGVYAGSIITPSFAGINFFMDSGSKESQKVLDFFQDKGHKIKEQSFFYLGSVSTLEPPFHFTNRSLVAFLRTNFMAFWTQIKRYLNQDLGPKVICVSIMINKELIFFGFYIPSVPFNIKGWRTNSFRTLKFLELVQPSRSVSRISFKYFSQNRLQKRTDGIRIKESPKKILCAGLGSIGSNLLFYLSSLKLSDVVLCDPDKLALENVNRHLLSFHDVGKFKVDALTTYLTSNNPFLNIRPHKGSIVDLILKDLPLINSMDVIFCSIGKDSIESYILQCLANGLITKPMMLFWVEPYLLGGHVLYIHPSTGFSLEDLTDGGYYRYNVISSETYGDPKYQLLLREAGCQGSYVPYGKAAIALFFANLVPQLFSIINNNFNQNLAFSYVGDTSVAISHGILLSDFGLTVSPNILQINKI